MLPDVARVVNAWTIWGEIKFAGHFTPKKPTWWKNTEEYFGMNKNEKNDRDSKRD